MEYLIGAFGGASLGFYLGLWVMNRYWVDTDKISEWRRRALYEASVRLSAFSVLKKPEDIYAELIEQTSPYNNTELALFRAKFD